MTEPIRSTSRVLRTVRACGMLLGAALALGVVLAEEATFEGKPAAEWMKKLADPDPSIRYQAIQALRMLGACKPEVAPAVAACLNDSRNDIRCEAASLLGEIGAAASPLVPALLEALRDENPGVRRQVAASLGAIQVASAEVIQALMNRTQDPDPGVRIAAGSALAQLPAKDEILLLVFWSALDDRASEVRCWAVEGLGRLGPRAREAVPNLLPFLAEVSEPTDEAAVDTQSLRRTAIRTLARIGPDARATPPLLACLSSPDPRTRDRAAAALAAYGADVLPQLLERLREPANEFWVSAAAALKLMGKEAYTALPAISQLLHDPAERLRDRAAFTLLHMGEPGRRSLSAAKADPDPSVGKLARRSLNSVAVPEPFVGRTRDKERRLAAAGGGPETERAVAAALGWLARHCAEEGGWHPTSFQDRCHGDLCAGLGEAEYRVGVTGLCVLAFLGAGHVPRNAPAPGEPQRGGAPDFGCILERALTWLLAQQHPDGCIGDPTLPKMMYNHAIATQAIAEAYGMTGAARYRESAVKAVAFLTLAKNPYKGWRYSPRCGENDTFVTGWAVRALKAAELSGLEVHASCLEEAAGFVVETTGPKYGRCGYRKVEDASKKVVVPGKNDDYADHDSMTAMGMWIRLLATGGVNDPVLKLGATFLVDDLPSWDKVRKTNDYCYWHEGTFALYHYDGPGAPHAGGRWRVWNRALRLALLPHQSQEGCAQGSWDADDRWGFAAGRLGATALNALTLETYYRYPYLMGGVREPLPPAGDEDPEDD